MSLIRLCIAHIVIGVIAGGSLFDIVTDQEHWPFSNYAMYSWQTGDELEYLVLFGVTAGEPALEIPLRRYDYLQPLDPARLAISFHRLKQRAEPDHVLAEALRDCLARYERSRIVEHHDGPPLQSVRLYRLSWKLDPRAKNVDRPDRRELLMETR